MVKKSPILIRVDMNVLTIKDEEFATHYLYCYILQTDGTNHVIKMKSS